MSRGSEALTLVLASVAMGMIATDPELLRQLRDAAAKADVPFPADDINGTLLGMAAMDLLAIGREKVSDQDDEDSHAGHVHALLGMRTGMVIPMPQIEGAAQESASALSIASYATEFVHSVPGRLDAFRSWMRKEHPTVADGQEISREQVEAADRVITLMAKVTEQIADDRGENLRMPEDQGT